MSGRARPAPWTLAGRGATLSRWAIGCRVPTSWAGPRSWPNSTPRSGVAAGGRATTVLIGGDAGIGKTRLVDEFCARARDREASTARGVCVPIDGGGLPYGPVVGLLRDLAHQLGSPAAAEILAPVASLLGLSLPGVEQAAADYPPARHLTDELAKTRLFESILACFTRLAERSTVVLVFEDLQWADSASAELLGFLTRNLTDEPGAARRHLPERRARPRPPAASLAERAGPPPPGRRTLALEGLDRDEMAAMIGGILGHRPDWALVDAVWARSQGNPFFAEELTAARHEPVALRPSSRA